MPDTVRMKETWKKTVLQKTYGKETLEYHTDDGRIYGKSLCHNHWKEIKGYHMVEEKSEQRFLKKISLF